MFGSCRAHISFMKSVFFRGFVQVELVLYAEPVWISRETSQTQMLRQTLQILVRKYSLVLLRFVYSFFLFADNILRFMRQRRNARREANEPATSSSSAQTEQQAPALPVRRRNLSSRVAADRVASRLNPTTPGVSETINNSTESRLEALYNRSRNERRLAISRHRRRLHSGPDNDIHRVARSQTYSDLLDNPLGPTTRATRRSNQPRMMELVDLTASDTESSILSRLTRIPSSSSSSSGSSLSVPSPLSMDTSESDSSDSDALIRLPSIPLPINDHSSTSSSSSDHEEWKASRAIKIISIFPLVFLIIQVSFLFIYPPQHSKLFLIQNHFPSH